MHYSIDINVTPQKGVAVYENSYRFKQPYITHMRTVINKNSDSIINNVFTTNIIRNGKAEEVVFEAGYYSLAMIIAMINMCEFTSAEVITSSQHFGCIRFQSATTVDLSQAPDIKAILGISQDHLLSGGTYGENIIDITRNMQVIQVYSSIVKSSDLKIANQNNNLLTTIILDDPEQSFIQKIEDVHLPIVNSFDKLYFNFRDLDGNAVDIHADISFQITISDSSNNIEQEDFKGEFSISQVCNTAKTDVQLPNPLSFKHCYISSVSIYTDVKLYNVTTDQLVVINGNKDEYSEIIIPRGSYTIEEVIALMNTGDALFELIYNGQSAFHISASFFYSIDFTSGQEIKEILGFADDYINEEMITGGISTSPQKKCTLTSNNNNFMIVVDDTQHNLTIPTGIYSEEEFFNEMLSLIKEYIPTCELKKYDAYFEFISTVSLKVYSTGTNGIHEYWWSSCIVNRKSQDYTYIPRVGYFYYNANVKFNMVQEYIEILDVQHIKDHGIKVIYSDGVTKSWNLPQERFTVIEFFQKMISALSIDTYFDITYYRSTVRFISKNDVSAYFEIYSQIKENLNLPTTASTTWLSFLSNNYYNGINRKIKGTITVTHKEDNDKVYTKSYDGTYTIYKVMTELREMISEFVRNYYGIGDTNALLVYSTPFGATVTNSTPFNKYSINIKFGGTLIDDNIIKLTQYNAGTYYSKGTFKCFWKENQKTHNINLGYTNLENLKTGIIQTLTDKEYIDAVNPNIKCTVTGSTLLIDAPNSMISVEQTLLNSTQRYDDQITLQPIATELYSPEASIEITTENNTVYIGNKTYTIPTGMYTFEGIMYTLNNVMNGDYVISNYDTYYELVHNGDTVTGTLLSMFIVSRLENSIRFSYENGVIYTESADYIAQYPVDITHGYSNIGLYSNIVQSKTQPLVCNIPLDSLYKNYFYKNRMLIPCSSQLDKLTFEFLNENNKPLVFNGNIYLLMTFKY